jgi:hypothetical protein
MAQVYVVFATTHRAAFIVKLKAGVKNAKFYKKSQRKSADAFLFFL